MTDEQKNTDEKFRNCCEGMPFAEMMANMMGQKGEDLGFDCAEMMSKMKAMCPRPGDKNEETTEEVKKTHTASQ
jgi:hypothetical protein